jgi:hypothetical protein
LKTLQQSVREQQVIAELGPPPDNNFGDEVNEDDATTDQEDDDPSSFVVIDVLVRPGETYELRLSHEDDAIQVAHEFASDVGMDDEARDRLIESLASLQVS